MRFLTSRRQLWGRDKGDAAGEIEVWRLLRQMEDCNVWGDGGHAETASLEGILQSAMGSGRSLLLPAHPPAPPSSATGRSSGPALVWEVKVSFCGQEITFSSRMFKMKNREQCWIWAVVIHSQSFRLYFGDVTKRSKLNESRGKKKSQTSWYCLNNTLYFILS